jgi:hypothetical protein
MNQLVQSILENFIYPALDSQNPLIQQRACWVYGKYGRFEFQNQDHLTAALQKILNLLNSEHLPVKVEAAVAISELIEVHELAQEAIRPCLGEVMRVYLRIMDEIDYEELIAALKGMVEIYGDEIAPYADSLSKKLS